MSATVDAPGFEKYFGDERVEAARELVKEIIVGGAYKATKFLSDKLTIKATRKRYKMDKGRPRKNTLVEIMITVGKPNYEEREAIKRHKKMGMVFPINHISAKFPKVKGAK